ncbi:MAG: hypothetical protein H6Q20_1349 [Bacteroidetes bacterium]|jgi:hypothetical protein|nr:hypothetical protein [Bacteroidota bacterium]
MKRLKTLCIILLIVFFGSLYQGAIMPFIEGVKYGLAIARYEIDSKTKTDDFLMMDVISKNPNYMETTETNLKTNDKVLIRPINISILVHSLPEKPVWWIILQVISGLLTAATLILGLWIPFLVVKILRSLQQSEVFERINLTRINRIGIIILAIGVFGSLMQSANIFLAQYMVDLTHYEFSYTRAIDFNSIIMGVVILIMNEVLKIAIEIKEEQDLTI